MAPFIPLMRPHLTEEDINSVSDVLRSGMLVQGKHVEKLEASLTSAFGSPYAAAICNGTQTLYLALVVLNIGPGDEVIVPAFSFMATANAVELEGATPVFVDIDIDTFNINASLIERAITPRTKAIMPVHEFGLSAEIGEIMSIAHRHNLYLIEDAACALGATENGRYVGTFGDFGSFSFHPRKAITTGEGGALLSKNAMHHSKVLTLRNHGIIPGEEHLEFSDFGYNFRLTDFQAALFNSQFIRLDQIIDKKQQLADCYFNALSAHPYIKSPVVPANKLHTWQTFHVVLPHDVDRNEMIRKMREHGIGTNNGGQCMPYMQAFQRKYSLDCAELFPNALRAYKAGLALPIYEGLSEADIHRVTTVLQKLVDESNR